jgi:hypothetical protein
LHQTGGTPYQGGTSWVAPDRRHTLPRGYLAGCTRHKGGTVGLEAHPTKGVPHRLHQTGGTPYQGGTWQVVPGTKAVLCGWRHTLPRGYLIGCTRQEAHPTKGVPHGLYQTGGTPYQGGTWQVARHKGGTVGLEAHPAKGVPHRLHQTGGTPYQGGTWQVVPGTKAVLSGWRHTLPRGYLLGCTRQEAHPTKGVPHGLHQTGGTPYQGGTWQVARHKGGTVGLEAHPAKGVPHGLHQTGGTPYQGGTWQVVPGTKAVLSGWRHTLPRGYLVGCTRQEAHPLAHPLPRGCQTFGGTTYQGGGRCSVPVPPHRRPVLAIACEQSVPWWGGCIPNQGARVHVAECGGCSCTVVKLP